ncbi:F-box protein At3g07870-like [Camellia sinensis]|uniref:F-box domain-containing protein n=1 Tax=Camellia sinensis var. sinensis TaxID=542762 RepID=A0A4S4EQF6_CAMSN|nr:F-box protein At3g07870-like [Camellia sinensis]THG18998.1 hypothetical protein TEA_008736 [Camellia sinensis var. sinensis]
MPDNLPEELLIEILIRLPIYTVVQFRCVSKSWCSLITSPNFINTYLNRTLFVSESNNTHSLLIRHLADIEIRHQDHYTRHWSNNDDPLDSHHFELQFPFRGFNKSFRIVSSCNGLVCLSNDLYCIMNNVIVWNPIINKSLTLPLPRISTYWLHGLANHVVGFGFDPKTIDYKVLKLTYFEEGPDHFRLKKLPSVKLYSHRLGSWRDIRVVAPMHLVHYNSSQAFVGETIIWVAVDKNRSNALILSFDLRDEVFGELNLSKSLVKMNSLTLSIVEFRKSLVVFHEPHISSSKCFVWVMKEYGKVESRTKLYTIDTVGMGEVRFLRRNGAVVLSSKNGLIAYNPKNQRLRDLGLHDVHFLVCVHAYIPSLVLLGKGNEILVSQAKSRDLQKLLTEEGNVEEEKH